jgi:hypothetical protein
MKWIELFTSNPLSWIASIICLLGMEIIIRKKSWYAFAVMGFSNILFIIDWIIKHEWPVMILSIVLLVQNVRAIIAWRKVNIHEYTK